MERAADTTHCLRPRKPSLRAEVIAPSASATSYDILDEALILPLGLVAGVGPPVDCIDRCSRRAHFDAHGNRSRVAPISACCPSTGPIAASTYFATIRRAADLDEAYTR